MTEVELLQNNTVFLLIFPNIFFSVSVLERRLQKWSEFEFSPYHLELQSGAYITGRGKIIDPAVQLLRSAVLDVVCDKCS